MKNVLVTGGCGYIGSHTLVDLINGGFNVISADNFSRSLPLVLDQVRKITGKKVVNYEVDLTDRKSVRSLFEENEINAIIHFAAFKSVSESVAEPLLYYRNNIDSLLTLLEYFSEFRVPHFIFSSSCSVYGNVEELPVRESTPLNKAESPYGRTKQMGEEILFDFASRSEGKFVLLRYFNPAGAHPSGLLGELPFGSPSNLVPAITQFATGRLPALRIFGTDYPTRDGTCVRDFVHVCDIASAHTQALRYLTDPGSGKIEVFNLGTGVGVTVAEAVKAFEIVTGKTLNAEKTGRREGDVVAIYSDSERANEVLKWKAEFGINDIMRTAWNWEQKLEALNLVNT